jgi:hypothetical protein
MDAEQTRSRITLNEPGVILSVVNIEGQELPIVSFRSVKVLEMRATQAIDVEK